MKITRPLGKTGLTVSALGLGAGQIGDSRLSEDDVGHLLNAALDMGVRFIDTARSYGLSEERIGRHLAHRRGDFVLSTKGGYGVEGVPDWTYETIAKGVDRALARMQTDVIDVFFLHSCPKEMLEAGEVVRALSDAKKAGKIRATGYSGENDALDVAVDSGAFDVLECSVNVCDQRAVQGAIARGKELGFVAKRPIANAPWRFVDRPNGEYCEAYWLRLRAMGWDALRGAHEWPELMLRFAAFAPGVATAILGTTRLANLELAARAVELGPLDDETLTRVREAFRAHDQGWIGQV
jgi:aryl-alcohol dehydrogenase-like predicted oxidoreductase